MARSSRAHYVPFGFDFQINAGIILMIENIDKMMNILKRDFSDHQIIIASISKYNFDEINIITIKDYLINNSN